MGKPLYAVKPDGQKSTAQIAREEIAKWRASQPMALPIVNQQTNIRGEALTDDEMQRRMQRDHLGKK